jgi:flagella basal body P-ring formation protein FlgA
MKNESVKVIYKKNNFQVTLNSTALQDGFENEKLKVRLSNNKELTGILKVTDGEKYVEI